MNQIIGLVGSATRRSRPRGRHLLAQLLGKVASRRTVDYRDRWGVVHTARFTDPMEALGFVGKPALPAELHADVHRGDWVIDVGANIGIVTAELSHIVGASGAVWAIEPFPPNIAKLHELARVNGLAQLHVYEGALSSTGGEMRLGLPMDGNSGHPSLAKTSGLSGQLTVQTWTLDELVEANDPSRPLSFIKIDVEGHEPAVLEGAVKTLTTAKPIVYCELNDELLREGASSAVDLIAQFRDMGYRPTKIFREGRPLSSVPAGTDLGTIVPLDTMVVDVLLYPGRASSEVD